MSYILEALEKSENERQQQAVPDLQTQPTLYPGAKRPRHRRLKTTHRRFRPAILFSLLILLTVWLFRDQIPVALEIKITRQTTLTDAPAPTTSPVPENQPAPAEETASDHPAQPPAAEPAPEQIPRQPAMSAATPEVPPAQAEEQVEDTSEQLPAPAPEQSVQTATAQTPVTLQPAPLLLTDADNPEAVTALPTLPFVEELPASVRDALPRLQFAGHTFSANPKNRLIIINNNIKREGDTVEQGLKLEEITWDGIVLNSRGIRFQVITTTN